MSSEAKYGILFCIYTYIIAVTQSQHEGLMWFLLGLLYKLFLKCFLKLYAGPPRGGVAGATAPGPGPRQGPVKIKLCFSIICFCDIIELGPARGPEESNFHLVRSTLH